MTSATPTPVTTHAPSGDHAPTRFAAVPDSPIACTLPMTEMGGRLRDFDDLFRRHLRSVERQPGRVVIALDADGLTEGDITDLLAREHECCAFLDIELRRDATGFVVDFRSPDGAESVLDAIGDLAGGARLKASE